MAQGNPRLPSSHRMVIDSGPGLLQTATVMKRSGSVPADRGERFLKVVEIQQDNPDQPLSFIGSI